jgi:hypothetical protein
MSLWASVLDEADAHGGTPAHIATQLGLPISLVQAVLDQAERLGVLAVAGRSCGAGCPSGPERPAACAGCVISLP